MDWVLVAACWASLACPARLFAGRLCVAGSVVDTPRRCPWGLRVSARKSFIRERTVESEKKERPWLSVSLGGQLASPLNDLLVNTSKDVPNR